MSWQLLESSFFYGEVTKIKLYTNQEIRCLKRLYSDFFHFSFKVVKEAAKYRLYNEYWL